MFVIQTYFHGGIEPVVHPSQFAAAVAIVTDLLKHVNSNNSTNNECFPLCLDELCIREYCWSYWYIHLSIMCRSHRKLTETRSETPS
jgi:hypothetical protein